jgi:hypothetical protein
MLISDGFCCLITAFITTSFLLIAPRGMRIKLIAVITAGQHVGYGYDPAVGCGCDFVVSGVRCSSPLKGDFGHGAESKQTLQHDVVRQQWTSKSKLSSSLPAPRAAVSLPLLLSFRVI